MFLICRVQLGGIYYTVVIGHYTHTSAWHCKIKGGPNRRQGYPLQRISLHTHTERGGGGEKERERERERERELSVHCTYILVHVESNQWRVHTTAMPPRNSQHCQPLWPS